MQRRGAGNAAAVTGGGSRAIKRAGSYSGPGEDDDDVRGYAWEDKFVGSWKNVVETEEGGLEVHRADEVGLWAAV